MPFPKIFFFLPLSSECRREIRLIEILWVPLAEHLNKERSLERNLFKEEERIHCGRNEKESGGSHNLLNILLYYYIARSQDLLPREGKERAEQDGGMLQSVI